MKVRSLIEVLELQPKSILWMLVLLTTIFLGWLDYITGFELSLSLFYLAPISIASWTMSRMAGLITSFFAIVVWLFADSLVGAQLSSPLFLYWNAITRFGFFVVVTLLLAELRQLLEHERTLASTDFLTGALNRRAFYLAVDREIIRVGRYHHPCTLLYIDLDNFKTINDQMGHDMGDSALQVVVQVLCQMVRSIDTVARLGGDEFAVLLPETDGAAAQVTASRLQQALLAEMAHYNWPITFSIGALTCSQVPLNSQALIRLADRLMYGVKNTTKGAIGYSVYPD